jgi:hypothetical protein
MAMAEANSTVTFRDIAGFPGYRVGDDGSVWSAWAKASTGERGGIVSVIGSEWRRMKAHPNDSGHLRVALGHSARRYVHHLVLEAFVGPCPDGLEGCHEDGDPTNNHHTNLRWGTRKSNMEDRTRHGTTATVLCESDVLSIRCEYAAGGITQQKLADKFGVSLMTINHILKRRTRRHLP